VSRIALRSAADGRVVADGRCWLDEPTAADERLLALTDGPVIDVGCGPGRHVLALARRGVVALGIDVSLHALERARQRGAPVLQRSIFGRVPGPGRWGTALLLDGNIGIGGRPETLLRRVRELLRADGRILAELAPPGTGGTVERVYLEVDGRTGPAFEWTRVDSSGITAVAARAGLAVETRWTDDGRTFAALR
jgi:SAM-dependent methyltransferase